MVALELNTSDNITKSNCGGRPWRGCQGRHYPRRRISAFEYCSLQRSTWRDPYAHILSHPRVSKCGDKSLILIAGAISDKTFHEQYKDSATQHRE